VPGDDDDDIAAPVSMHRGMSMMMGMMGMGMRHDDDDDDDEEKKDDSSSALRGLPTMLAEQLLKCLGLLGARFISATSRMVQCTIIGFCDSLVFAAFRSNYCGCYNPQFYLSPTSTLP
jgi:hypothetical protein